VTSKEGNVRYAISEALETGFAVLDETGTHIGYFTSASEAADFMLRKLRPSGELVEIHAAMKAAEEDGTTSLAKRFGFGSK
jgi:hypothetical protein